jgi:hypothetical protein
VEREEAIEKRVELEKNKWYKKPPVKLTELKKPDPPVPETPRKKARPKNGASSALEKRLFSKDQAEEKLTPNRVPEGTPTSLENLFNFEGHEKNLHETLGILVEAHKREAKAILSRTRFLTAEEVVTVADLFHFAEYGIGGTLAEPMPFVSEWGLDILNALPSLGGGSRKEFVDAWSNAEKERARQQAEIDKTKGRIGS